MSVVTNILILCEVDEDIDPIQKFLPHPLKEISMRAGGNKAFEADVWAGAYNHLDVESFKQQIADIWRLRPSLLQVLIKEENDEKFSLIELQGWEARSN